MIEKLGITGLLGLYFYCLSLCQSVGYASFARLSHNDVRAPAALLAMPREPDCRPEPDDVKDDVGAEALPPHYPPHSRVSILVHVDKYLVKTAFELTESVVELRLKLRQCKEFLCELKCDHREHFL